jgi:C-terminal processing protease CtpA/Prc
VWVVEVLSGEIAQGNLQPKDVILKINHHPVNNIKDMKEALIKAGKEIQIIVFRNQKEMAVTLIRAK